MRKIEKKKRKWREGSYLVGNTLKIEKGRRWRKWKGKREKRKKRRGDITKEKTDREE